MAIEDVFEIDHLKACLLRQAGQQVGVNRIFADQRQIGPCRPHAMSQRLLGEMAAHGANDRHAMSVGAARVLCYRSATRLDTSKATGLDAVISELFVSEAYLASAEDAVRVHGGCGIMAEYGIERALRDSVAGVIYSGTNDMQRNIIAQWLGLSAPSGRRNSAT